MTNEIGGKLHTHLTDLPCQYKGLADYIVGIIIGRQPDAVDGARSCTTSLATAPQPARKICSPRTVVAEFRHMAKAIR